MTALRLVGIQLLEGEGSKYLGCHGEADLLVLHRSVGGLK